MGDLTFSAQAAKNIQDYGNHHVGAHLYPLRDAMANKLIEATIVFRDSVGMLRKDDLPNVVIVFDVMGGGTGPGGFSAKLIDDLAKVAVAAVVVTKFDAAEPYEQSIALALHTRGLVILVETVEDRASEWLSLVNVNQKLAVWSLWAGNVAGRA